MKTFKELRAEIKENYDGRTRDGRALKSRLETKMLERAKAAIAKESEAQTDLIEASAFKNVPAEVLKKLGRTDKNQLANIISGKNDLSDRTSEKVYDALYDYYSDNGMPYGVASARDGDPYEWILDQIT
mgnify:CR=1 FL=1|tara:strand:- start:871 stop:1257 length:387 start_codon:yes stop_codon:yes gene_type:complete